LGLAEAAGWLWYDNSSQINNFLDEFLICMEIHKKKSRDS
jgi:hypothetical protein